MVLANIVSESINSPLGTEARMKPIASRERLKGCSKGGRTVSSSTTPTAVFHAAIVRYANNLISEHR
jgi:hypothetical protein